MARLTGKAGAATLGSLTTIVLDGWEYEETSTNIESHAAGDTHTDRTHLRLDWRATIRGFLAVTPPYANIAIPVGTEAAMALKALSADTNPLIADTGLVTRARIEWPHDNLVRIEAEIMSSDGSAGPTVDTSPAS